MDYKNSVDKSFGMTTSNMNDGFKKTSDNLDITKQIIKGDIDKTNLDVKGLQIKNEAIATQMTNVDTNLTNFDTSLKKYFTFYDNNTAIQNDKLYNHVFSGISPDLELMAQVHSVNGLTIRTPTQTIDERNLKICNDLNNCIHLNVNSDGFNITPDNVNGLTINSKSGPPLAKFDMDNNGIYLGGSDINAPLFIQDGNLFINNINMILNPMNESGSKDILRVTASDIDAMRNWSSNVAQEMQQQYEIFAIEYLEPALQYAQNEYVEYQAMKNNYSNMTQSLSYLISTSNNSELETRINNLSDITNSYPRLESRINHLDNNYSNIYTALNTVNANGDVTSNAIPTSAYLDLVGKVNNLNNIKDNYPTLVNRVGGLESSRSSLMSDITGLTNNYTTLNGKVDGVVSGHIGLDSTVTGLRSSYSGLNNRVDNLETSRAGINDSITGLTNNYNGLNTNVTNLTNSYNGLNTSVSGLNTSVTEIKNVSIPDLVAKISKLMQYENDIPAFFMTYNSLFSDGTLKNTLILKIMNRMSISIGDKLKIRIYPSDIGNLNTSYVVNSSTIQFNTILVTTAGSTTKGEYHIVPTSPFTLGQGSTISKTDGACEITIVSGINLPAYSSIQVTISGKSMLDNSFDNYRYGFVIGKHLSV